MTIGDPGPYINDDGDVWVPRTVPYLEARQLVRGAEHEFDDRLTYEGKQDVSLFGFARDCLCDEHCEMAGRCRTCHAGEGECGCWAPDPEDLDICRVAAWHFRWDER